MENYFTRLNSINVNDKTESKNGLTYLSWAWAWGEVKKLDPDANYKVYERDTDFGPVNYFTDGKTCWVKTGVTVNGIEHIEQLPVMNYKNQSLALEVVTSFDVNKTIQRSLTKAVARHGLGLYIYAGEDLPESAPVEPAKKPAKAVVTDTKAEEVVTSSTTDKKPFTELISEIGKIAQKLYKEKGTMDEYNKIVKEVTKDPTFKCNSATEDQYDIVLAIYNKLVANNG